VALADDLGGVATVANLPKGARTATIESKTNFFAAIPAGEAGSCASSLTNAMKRGPRAASPVK
jgi:acyl-coenzyme A thioesterase PaaI-like protein